MNMSKRAFVQGLQVRDQVLSPYEISQAVRLAIGCVSRVAWDHKLPSEHSRGYMLRPLEKPDRTPENPQWYECVVATDQSLAWQHLIWTKEILHILDDEGERTNSEAALRQMLELRHTEMPSDPNSLPSTEADKNGLILALACAVPFRYRVVLRKNNFLARYSLDELEKALVVPKEKVEFLLAEAFESHFETALNNRN